MVLHGSSERPPSTWAVVVHCGDLHIKHIYWLFFFPVSLSLFLSSCFLDFCYLHSTLCVRLCFQANPDWDTLLTLSLYFGCEELSFHLLLVIAHCCFSLVDYWKKEESSRKTSISALLTMPKPLTVWITINCGKFFKRWEYQTMWPASWETYMQVRKQQLELDMEQQTGSK